MGHHQRGVEAVRVVVVQLAALLIGQFVMALVVAVMVDDADLVYAKVVAQALGQGRFAAAGTTGDVNDNGVHILFAPFILPARFCGPSAHRPGILRRSY